MAGLDSNYVVFHWLNLLRGLAVFAVLLFHAGPILGYSLTPSGYLAVDLFFILSGFVIAHAYDPRFATDLNVRAFVQARAVRFWPLFALGNAIGAAWLVVENIAAPPAAMTIGETFAGLALALLYLPQVATGDLFPLNVPAWSLLFELLVNTAFAAFFASSKTRWLPITILAAGAGVAVLIGVGLFDVQAWGILRAVYGFAAGVLLYRRHWQAPSVPVWLIIAGVCATFAMPASAAVEAACVFVIYPVAIVLLAQAADAGQSRVLAQLGVLSFPLYALHYPILQAALGARDHLPFPSAMIGLAAIAACLGAAWLADTLLDRPLRIGLRRLITAP